ncbi:hypothetical protein DOY81_003629 [Sarcophaga bullata]|nr:hypothetical protein DOY81_003629 [Sarcophaga bullata]
MWLSIIATALMCLLIADFLYKIRRKNILKLSGIPGPPYTVPLLGDIAVAFGVDTLNVFNLLNTLTKQYGKVFHMCGFHRLFVIIRDPKFFEVILGSPTLTRKPFVYDMISSWLGDGLLNSHGSKWHARRKILTPTYHFKILEEFVEIFDKESDVLVRKLASKADALISYPSETAMGVQINAQKNPDFPYALAVKEATNIFASRIVRPIQYYNITYLLTALPAYLRLRKCLKVLHDFTDKIINNRRAKMYDNNGISSEESK